VCTLCRGNVFTKPLPSNHKGIHVHKLMGGIFEVRCWDGLRCHDIHTESHKDWFRHSQVDGGYTDVETQQGDRISLLLFFLNKESRLRIKLILEKWFSTFCSLRPPVPFVIEPQSGPSKKKRKKFYLFWNQFSQLCTV
jgi:hypothetical protein